MQPNQNSSSSGNADSPASYVEEGLPPQTPKDWKGISIIAGCLILFPLIAYLDHRESQKTLASELARQTHILQTERVHWWQLGFSEGQQFSLQQARGVYTNVAEAVHAAEARFVEIKKEALK